MGKYFILSRDLFVNGSVVLSYFNQSNCAFVLGLVRFHFIKWLSCCEWIFGQILLTHLKQLNEELKGEVRLLDSWIRPNAAMTRKRNLHVGRTRE